MTYREPAPRQPRLWYVTMAYRGMDADQRSVTNRHHCGWYWAAEADEALEQAIEKQLVHCADKHRTAIWHWEVICGEDFAEREAKGPPKAP